MLADAGVRAAKSKERGYKLNDSGGLVLFITKSGGKLWRIRYMYRGKEKLLSFGPYPKVSLLNARDQRDAAKAVLREGTRLFKNAFTRRSVRTLRTPSKPLPEAGTLEAFPLGPSGMARTCSIAYKHMFSRPSESCQSTISPHRWCWGC